MFSIDFNVLPSVLSARFTAGKRQTNRRDRDMADRPQGKTEQAQVPLALHQDPWGGRGMHRGGASASVTHTPFFCSEIF